MNVGKRYPKLLHIYIDFRIYTLDTWLTEAFKLENQMRWQTTVHSLYGLQLW